MGRLVMPPPSGGLNLVDPPSKMRDDQCQQADNVLSVPQGLEVFAGYADAIVTPPSNDQIFAARYSRVGAASEHVAVVPGWAGYAPADITGLGAGATATITVTSTVIVSAVIGAAGSGYAVGDIVSVTHATGVRGVLKVATVSGTGVATWSVVKGGIDYTASTCATVLVWKNVSSTFDSIGPALYLSDGSFIHYGDELYFASRAASYDLTRPHKFSYDAVNGYTFSPVGRRTYQPLSYAHPRVRPVVAAQVSSGSGATITYTDSAGAVNAITAAAPAGGTGYLAGDRVRINGGTLGAVAEVDTVVAETGAVATWVTTPVVAGTGYTGASGVATTSGLLNFNVVSRGGGYTINPTAELVGGGSPSPAANPTPRMRLEIATYTPYSPGTGYSAGTFEVAPSAGSGCTDRPTATITVSGGAVTSIIIATQGSGWTGLSYLAEIDDGAGGGSGCKFTPVMELDDMYMDTAAKHGAVYTETPTASFYMRTGVAGVYPQASGVGPLNGLYEYAFTYEWVDSDGAQTYETDLSEVVYSPTLTTNSVAIRLYKGNAYSSTQTKQFDIPPVPSYLCVYRKSATQSYFYRVGRVAYADLPYNSAVAYTYIDSLSDNDVGVIAPTGHGLPPPCKFLVAWKRRMWYINTSNGEGEILYSALDSPEYTAVDPNPLYPNSAGSFITDEGLDAEITGAAAVRDALVVFTKKAQYVIRGNDATDFRMDRVSTDGCALQGSAASIKDAVIWYSPTGFRMWDTTNGMTFVGRDLGVITTSTPVVNNTPAMVWKDYYICAEPSTTLGNVNLNMDIYAFNTLTGGWTKIIRHSSLGRMYGDISSPLALYESEWQGQYSAYLGHAIGVYSTSAAGLAVTVKRKLLDMGDPTKHKVVTTLSQEFQQTAQQSFNLILYGQASTLSTTALTTEAGAGAAKYAVTHLRAGAREVAPGLTMAAGVPQTTIGRTVVEFAERGVARV